MRKSIFPIVALVGAGLVSAAPRAAKPASPAPQKDPAADINAPRSDARAVEFEAREGTWMSVDVSPDGKTLVFDLLGDIYSMPIAGGEAHALTSGPAWDAQPRFSPDGTTIAFSSDRGGIENLWLMDADGGHPRFLTSEKDAYVRSPAWTPDGAYLVARKEDAKRAGIPPVELWLYHREGGGGIKLVSSDDMNNSSGPVLSKDGRFLYFSARQPRFSYTPDLSQGLWRILRYDRATGESLPLTGGYGGAARPALSPDGRTLTFISRRDTDAVLVRRDLASGAEQVIATGLTRDEQEGFAQMDLWPAYAFTPDGAAIVFSSHGKLRRLELASGQTAEIPFSAKVKQWLAPRVSWQEKVDTGPVRARILRWTSQSPDGKWIAFDAFGRVWLQELAGGRAVGSPRRLTADGAELPSREYAPTFSPDGKAIAYVTWSDAEGGHVWKAPLVGPPQRLSRAPGHYANPAWSPQGDRLSVIRGSGLEFRGRQPEDEDYFELGWMDAGGGDLHLVTAVKLANAMRFHPQAYWSPDGTRLYFRDPVEVKKPTDDPKNDLVSVRLDGTDKRRHLRLPPVDDLVPSPDARWIVFTSRDNVYVAALPDIATREPAEVSLKEGAVPVWRVSDAAGGYAGWADGGRTITWSLGPTFYRLGLDAAVRFAQEERRKAEEKEKEKGAGAAGAKDKRKSEAEKKDDDELKLPPAEAIEIQLALPRAQPQGSFVLKNARVVTMKGDAVLDDADVVVTGNRIAAVGPSGQVPVPAG
ncbi:MAG TPA: hypothetical protein VGN09_29340, partial [Vicinamibacteria bacterium]